jgi:hypothetical protein
MPSPKHQVESWKGEGQGQPGWLLASFLTLSKFSGDCVTWGHCQFPSACRPAGCYCSQWADTTFGQLWGLSWKTLGHNWLLLLPQNFRCSGEHGCPISVVFMQSQPQSVQGDTEVLRASLELLSWILNILSLNSRLVEGSRPLRSPGLLPQITEIQKG